jgi:hypothetical protein
MLAALESDELSSESDIGCGRGRGGGASKDVRKREDMSQQRRVRRFEWYKPPLLARLVDVVQRGWCLGLVEPDFRRAHIPWDAIEYLGIFHASSRL